MEPTACSTILISLLCLTWPGLAAPDDEGVAGLLGSKKANLAFALIHCDAETDTEEKYEACRGCFEMINDFNNEDGLADAKHCIERYLPKSQVKNSYSQFLTRLNFFIFFVCLLKSTQKTQK